MTNLYDAHKQWLERPPDERFPDLQSLYDFTKNRQKVSLQRTESLSKLHLCVTKDGAMVKVSYPTGGIKLLGYKKLADSLNFTKLDVMSMDSSTQKPKSYWSENIFLLWKGGTSWTVGYWDGYWNTLDFSATGNTTDKGAVSPDGWAVIHSNTIGNDLTVLRWRGGYWQVDTIVNAISNYSRIYLYGGDDCFIAVTGTDDDNDEHHLREAKYFRWNGSNWKGFLVRGNSAPGYETDFGRALLRDNIFILSDEVCWEAYGGAPPNNVMGDSAHSYFTAGRYDAVADTVIISLHTYGTWSPTAGCPNKEFTGNLIIGHDYVGWKGWSSIGWLQYFNSGWTLGGLGYADTKANSLTQLPNGFAFNYSLANGTGQNSYVVTSVPTGDTFTAVSFGVNVPAPNQQVAPLYGGYNVLGGLYPNDGYDWWFWRWNGVNWRYTGPVADGASNYSETMLNFGVSWVFGPNRWADPYGGQIGARAFHGIGGANMSPPDSGWPINSTIANISTDKPDGFSASDQMFLCRTSGHYMYLNNLFYFGTQWHPFFVRHTYRPGASAATNKPATDALAAYGAFHETFSMYNNNAFWEGPNYRNRYWQYGYKLVDTTFTGKAPIYVVDSVLTYRYADDVTPTIQKYKYFGGLLDPSGTTPRFARAEISTPFFASEGGPDGYEAHCFYNDIDTTGFYDPTVYNTMVFPDLKSSARYGIANGGFRMDGTEYYSYSYTVGDAVAKKNDYSKSFHSWSQTLDSLPEVYRQKTDSVFVRQDSLTSQIYYKYDARNGQVCRTAAKYVGTNAFIVDSVIFGYQVDTLMLADNALVQASEQIRRFDSNGVAIKTLKKSGSTFTRKGGWQVDKSFTWRNLANLNDTLFTFKTLPSGQSFDAYGNLIASLNPNSDTSCVKIGDDGMTPVATAKNCSYKDLLVQEFEQSPAWDNWVQWTNAYMWIDSTVWFTGRKALYMTDDSNNPERSWGSYRLIQKSDLSGKLYHFSGWVKSNWTVTVYCWCSDSLNNLCSGGYKTKSFNLSSSGGTSWQRIEGWFDLSDVWTCMNKIQVQLVLEHSATSGKFAYFDDFRFQPVDAVVSTMVVDNTRGLVVAQAGATNYPTTTEYDSYQRPIISKDFKGRTLGKSSYYLSLSDHTKFDTLNPNYVKTIKFRTDTDSVVSISYFDGVGRTLQNRSTDKVGSTIAALVSGIATYDGRGRVIKGYKPYNDLSGSADVTNYSTPAVAIGTEIPAYWDGDPGANCGLYPYSQNAYAENIKSIVDSSAGSGPDYHMDSDHVNKGKTYTDTLNGWIVSESRDADNILVKTVADRWGRWSKVITPYTKSDGTAGENALITYKDIQGRVDSIIIDSGSGSAQILIRNYEYNDLNQQSKDTRVDYGLIWMRYDKNGNLRFMANVKRLLEDKFVYYKYDKLGRKIEEGLASGIAGNFLSQTKADDQTWPTSANSPDIRYRWYYDFYASGTDTVSVPGQLIKVISKDSTYYRKFESFPTGDSSRVIVKLPSSSGSLKSIRNYHNRDGSLISKVISPKYPTMTGQRVITYGYDAAGRMASVGNGFLTNYAEYTYLADGSPRDMLYGVYTCDDSEICSPFVYDTLQSINYQYNAAGSLMKINSPDSIVGSLTGFGAANDHFGEELKYSTSTPVYWNGRIADVKTANSSGSSAMVNQYKYTYNELSWLTYADHQSDSTLDQKFMYNALGQRKKVVKSPFGAGDTVTYNYNTATPGSSRLVSFTGMSPKIFRYDTLGNLLSDSARNIYSMSYDYRNLMTNATMLPTISQPTTLLMVYDETGNRIFKHYGYQVWTTCIGDPNDFTSPPPGEEEILNGAMAPEGGAGSDSGGEVSNLEGPDGPGGGSYPCPAWSSSSTFYLYDGGALLATFDANDNVIDMFVNGPQGRIASYYQNNNSYLYYYMADHLGSSRVMMQGVPFPQNYQVAEYYNYQPFGQTIQAWGSYATPFKFTGKERDQHSTFDYDYFGARYYDPRIGQFSSVDAAGQFASGYVYGGNNPIMGVDRDGNLFFLVPILISAAYSAGASAAAYTAVALANGVDGKQFWKGLLSASLTGALTGGISGGLGFVGGKLAQSSTYSLLSNTAASTASSAIAGGDITWGSVLGSMGGSLAASKVMGNFSATSSSITQNAVDEFVHTGASGAIAGVSGGLIEAGVDGKSITAKSLASRFTNGFIGGVGRAAYEQGLFGYPVIPNNATDRANVSDLEKSSGAGSVVFRTGGIVGKLSGLGSKSLGEYVGNRTALIAKSVRDDINPNGTWVHEYTHHVQSWILGDSRSMMRVANELSAYGSPNVYASPLTLEWQASWVERMYGYNVYGNWGKW
jgi:RHS repeat-associated protein